MIPESPFYLEGHGGLFQFVEKRLKENGHVVIVVAEGAGQDYVAQSINSDVEKDASGNKLLHDVGPWLSQHIKVIGFIFHFQQLNLMILLMTSLMSLKSKNNLYFHFPRITLQRFER